MHRMKALCVGIGFLSLLLVRGARAQILTARTPMEKIDITTRFHGQDVLVFGVAPRKSDLIVTLQSPPADLSAMEKGRVGIVWMDVEKVRIKQIPQVSLTVSSKPVDLLLDEGTREKLGIGYAGIARRVLFEGNGLLPREKITRQLIQKREADGMFMQRSGDVKIYDQKLFQTTFHLPDDVSPGQYIIRTYAVRNGAVVEQAESAISVEKAGVEAWVSNLALDHEVLYGLMAVFSALGMGILSGLVFRRIGA